MIFILLELANPKLQIDANHAAKTHSHERKHPRRNQMSKHPKTQNMIEYLTKTSDTFEIKKKN